MRSLQITDWCHAIFQTFVLRDGVYVDATMGKGRDTLFLCRLAGEKGQVWAFDIQEEALKLTGSLLETEGMSGRARLILCGHDGICFNFGYLPGGDHRIATQAETSVAAVEQGLRLLKPGGVMSLCIYSGGDTGFAEKEALLGYLKKLPSEAYTVILSPYYNRRGDPPLPVFVFRQK